MRTVPFDRRPVIDGEIARVALTQGQVAIIDAADAALIGGYRWCALRAPIDSGFYAVAWMKGDMRDGNVQMHRFLMQPSADNLIDHANRNGLDNRRANLRICTQSQNLRNARKRHGTTSPYLGVSLHSESGTWQAAVKATKGKRKHLGFYATDAEAAHARDNYIREHCDPTDFWTFNFPRPGEPSAHIERKTA